MRIGPFRLIAVAGVGAKVGPIADRRRAGRAADADAGGASAPIAAAWTAIALTAPPNPPRAA
jgi:hypothetical protein